jgi:hypothetical protein
MPWAPPVSYVLPDPFRYPPSPFERCDFERGDPEHPRQPSRVVRNIALAVIVAVPLMVASAVGYYTRNPSGVLSPPTKSTIATAQEKPAPSAVSYPNQWDPRVAAIAEFVERERELAFKHPVAVDFLTSEQYHDAVVAGDEVVVADDEGGSNSNVMTEADTVAEFRALGLISGEVDLGAANDTLADSGTLAFYSPDDKRVRVRGSDMTPGLRVTLAHELTHALQDQNFDLALGPINRASTFRAIVEGDATRIEYIYESKILTGAEREQMATSDEAARAAYEAQLTTSNIPTVLSTAFGLPYAVGPQFVEIVAARGGNSAVDAITIFPPASEVALLDPLRPNIDGMNATVPRPRLPAGAEVLDHSSMGAGLMFLLLGERSEPDVALEAAFTWQGDASVISRQQGRVCFDADFFTAGSADALLAGMTAWATAMPAEAGADASGTAFAVHIHSCDPGTGVAFAVAGRTQQTLTYAAIRSELELELARDTDLTNARATCIADEATSTISAVDLATGSFDMIADPELTAAIRQAILTC